MKPEVRVSGRVMPKYLCLWLALALNPVAVAETSLQQDVMPILNQHCVMCHLPGAALGGLDLYSTPWAAMVNAQSTQVAMVLIEPFEPDQSYFYLKLTQRFLDVGGTGLLMPIQQEALNNEQMEVIRSWIEQGAQDN